MPKLLKKLKKKNAFHINSTKRNAISKLTPKYVNKLVLVFLKMFALMY
jgi:hypothetical protein